MSKKILECVYSNEEFQILKYKPSLTQLFYIDMEPMTLKRRIRFMVDYIYGYSVYYLKKCGGGTEIIGYCTVTSGKNPRFWFAKSDDIIIGPYYVNPKERGKGYATKMVDAVINHSKLEWKTGYVVIRNNNPSSIYVTQNVGGRILFYVHNTKSKRLIKDPNGECGIYLLENKSVAD